MQPSQTPSMSTNAPPPSTSTPLQQRRARPGPWPPVPPPNSSHHSTATGSTTMLPPSWAKKTGFKGTMSGESNVTDSGQILPPSSSRIDLESGFHTPKTLSSLSAPVSAAVVTTSAATIATTDHNNTRVADDILKNPSVPSGKDPPVKKRKESNGHVRFDDAPTQPHPPPSHTRDEDHHRHHASLPQLLEDEHFLHRRSHIKYELRDRPGLVPIAFYGLQHYLSMLGSLILLPLVIIPAMGGTQDDTSTVVSTVLLVSGITTLLHTSFGTRLPLVQGPSFVYLAPVLAIINSSEFLGLTNNNFKHVMKELQGAIIISSAFQAIMGYTGFMSILLRFINPVVVSPTIAAVGLSFFSYGFTRVSMCLEIGIVQILLVVILSLYLRKISVFGHRVFLIYTVPLGLGITWAVAFLLTEIGAYSYKGCDINVPPSNTVSDYCRKHVARMKHCRVDTYHALKSSPWIRVPLPLQWGTPILNWKMVVVMCVVSIIASVDSVGSYHASSLLVASRPPTAGVLSRGIGLEGFSSVLAGLWGTGTGSTTLTENVHTIAVTKMGSRRGVEVGAFILIVLSFVGKVGGFIASIPDVIVAALLCFMWAMLAALGLSNLRYSEAGSSRNVIIVGLSLFFSLSIPSYFQQYGTVPNANSSVPSYFQAYTVSSHGPFHGKYSGVNYVMNTLLSLHMVIAFLIAVILDNTVPGSRQERGVYVWSETEAARREPTVAKDYELPFRVGRLFRWVKWVGL